MNNIFFQKAYFGKVRVKYVSYLLRRIILRLVLSNIILCGRIIFVISFLASQSKTQMFKADLRWDFVQLQGDVKNCCKYKYLFSELLLSSYQVFCILGYISFPFSYFFFVFIAISLFLFRCCVMAYFRLQGFKLFSV